MLMMALEAAPAVASFSSVLRVTDLDDFIAPSQDCIKPIITSAAGEVGRHERGPGGSRQVAQISLNDCLACSGCITSAESVLITQQSVEEFRNTIRYRDQRGIKLVVVSLSPQSLVSLARRFTLSVVDTYHKLSSYLKSQHRVDVVTDIITARDISLLETRREFLARYNEEPIRRHLPMMTSACPGWICYAEKSHGSWILPYISRVKSPQQVMGSLVKHYMSVGVGVSAKDVYHVTVMPCYDKKLEASRSDFTSSGGDGAGGSGCRDVDCVLSTSEIEQMLLSDGVTELSVMPMVSGEQPEPGGHWMCSVTDDGKSVYSHSGGASGGYLEHTLRAFLPSPRPGTAGTPAETLQYKVLRNQDIQEVTVTVTETRQEPATPITNQRQLRFAKCYGFRNIQNMVQKIKRGKCPYDFIEVMACPGGCLNGGGQVKDGTSTGAGGMAELSGLYESCVQRPPEENTRLTHIYGTWGVEGREKHLYTDYRHVTTDTQANINIKW